MWWAINYVLVRRHKWRKTIGFQPIRAGHNITLNEQNSKLQLKFSHVLETYEVWDSFREKVEESVEKR